MSEVKRMTFGSRCVVVNVNSGSVDIGWIQPKRGRWLVETLRSTHFGGLFDVVGLFVPPRFDATLVKSAMHPITNGPHMRPDIQVDEKILGENRVCGSFGCGALVDGIPLEADEISIGSERVLVIVVQNISGGVLPMPSFSAICRRIEP